jgi:hypothetical protein
VTKSEFLEAESRKCRTLADAVSDEITRTELLRLAAEYEADATAARRMIEGERPAGVH